jgi:SAM-dependent methyltransferase
LRSARLAFLNWLEEYLSKQGVKGTEVWQTLQEELWSYHHPHLYRLLSVLQHLMQQIKCQLKPIARQALPAPVHRWLGTRWQGQRYCPPVGMVDFGNLRRVTPISREFGYDRGLPIDRYYIEKFLMSYANDIRGRMLEIGDNSYTQKFGGSRVTTSDVLHVTEGNPQATFIGDLTSGDHIPSNTFDCFILTQTLQFIYDMRAALQTICRILKPGGVVLATFSGISQIASDQWGDYQCWSFTTLSAQRLFEEVFPRANLKVETFGNVLAAMAFLQGLAAEELRQEELDYRDPKYQVLITVRAVKSEVAL